jgi:hypothetical protein
MTGSFEVSVTLHETTGIVRYGQLVTLGLPLGASNKLKRVDGFGILSPDGFLKATQFGVVCRWGGEPKDDSDLI